MQHLSPVDIFRPHYIPVGTYDHWLYSFFLAVFLFFIIFSGSFSVSCSVILRAELTCS